MNKSLPRIPKSGFKEIAELAGVSVSTVDRVLNERGTVSPAARAKVLAAAGQLDIRRILPALAQHRRIEIVMPQNATPFWQQLDAAFRQLSHDLAKVLTLHRTFLPQNRPDDWIRTISYPHARRDALIIAADGKDEFAQSLSRAAHRGEEVVTLTTRVDDGLPHSGIDNFSAGQMAGRLLYRGLPQGGDVLVLKATDRRRAHDERVAGFLSMGAPRDVHVITTRENPERTRSALRELLLMRDIAGIYTTEYCPIVMRDILRDVPRRPVWIGHEQTPEITDCISADLLQFSIDQEPEAQAIWALKLATRAWADLAPYFALARPPMARLLFRENLG
ncbi:LacI family DNA-binding transcriptional regulator [Thioclava sp. GXIMD4215]|uniref:LacI family DNA-binding transcriptional regulator n=1 Tax=Thioclava sp. GXIMD4215 TaxID=3131928 RepID=UPI00311B0962